MKTPDLRCHEIFEHMDAGFAYCQMAYDQSGEPVDFTFIHVNPAFAKQTGIRSNRIIGRLASKVIPTLKRSWLETYGQVVRGGGNKRFEDAATVLGKTYEVYAWRTEQGRFAAMFSDVSARTKSENEAKRYKSILESVEEPVFSKDLHGIIKTWNKSAEQIYGYTGREIIGKSALTLAPPSKRAEIATIMDNITAGQKIENYETTRVTKDGELLNIFMNVLPIVEDGKIVGASVVQHDVTGDKRANKRLQIINAKLQKSKLALMNMMEDLEIAKSTIEVEKAKDEAMLGSIGEGLVAIDTNKKIVVMNQAAELLLGWKASDFIGRNIASLPLEDEHGQPVPLHDRLAPADASPGNPKSLSCYFVRQDHVRCPVAINVTPVTLAGQTIGTVQTFRDTTQQTKVDRAKSEFISLASHQLRTPLGIIKWYLEALNAQGDIDAMPARTAGYFHEIYKNNERVLNLVRSLLSISHIDQGKIKDVPTRTDIGSLVRGVIEDLSIVSLQKKIQIRLRVRAKRLPTAMIDPLRLQEVVENLIANAVTYNKPSGKVMVTIDKRDDSDFTIAVADTGIGVSESEQQQLFTKFFRSEAAAMNNTEGSGLGLYLVKSYAEEWGGTVSVESTVNKGSTFTLTLPFKPMTI